MRDTDAFDAIQKALATDQIGTIVSVRIVAQLADEPAEIELVAMRLLDHALAWLDDTAVSVSSIGSPDQHQSFLLRSTRGLTGLLSAGLCLDNTPTVEVVVFGTRGTLLWEGDPGLSTAASSDKLAASSAARVAFAQQRPVAGRGPASARSRTAGHAESLLNTKLPSPNQLSPPYGLLLVSGDYTHQPGYADALLADGRCRLIGLTDEHDVPDARRQLNQQLADRLGVPVLPDLLQALQRDDVHAVSICAEPFRRGRVMVEAARAGKHLYLDKPLAGSLEDAHAIVAAVRESGVVAHMFTQVNWDPAQRVKKILDSGELGDLVAVHCDVCFAKGHGNTADLSQPRVESKVPARFELPEAKREFTNVGVYPVAMLLWLLRKDVKRVDAVTRNFFFAEHQTHDMEDFGQMLMEFEDGVTATISAGRAGWRSHPGFGLHRVCLIGTQASVTVDAHRPRVEVWADVQPWTAPPRDPGDPMGMWAQPPDSPYQARPKQSWVLPAAMAWADDAKQFLDCIEQGKQSQVSVDIGAASTEILLAGYRSAATDEPVELPLSKENKSATD